MCRWLQSVSRTIRPSFSAEEPLGHITENVSKISSAEARTPPPLNPCRIALLFDIKFPSTSWTQQPSCGRPLEFRHSWLEFLILCSRNQNPSACAGGGLNPNAPVHPNIRQAVQMGPSPESARFRDESAKDRI